MLDIDTRRRIDSARDILVGKVPDPKAQVEQITTALVYKFMDDVDKESIELGGKAQFFKNGYAHYAWSKLMDSRLGGHERLALYGEAITKMAENPNIPQLFRNIFKDAFLPYRDPETLNLFLKEINGFVYDHSERLGDAYEYLLSVLGSQGDAGQFRTPRHIIDFIVKVVDPDKTETILDPACGTAGFLISAFKHILGKYQKNKPGDMMTPAERKKFLGNFAGYDISPDMVRIALVNMYLHSFPDPSIVEYDTLTSEEKWDELYDCVLANPPFMTPKGGIRPHKRFSVQASRSEVLFVDYIMEHLTKDGRAGVIVPEGIIFQSQTAYKELRRKLVEENYLYAVVSLPAGVFNPYSGVKTSILLMDRKIARERDEILFVKVENDGFDLGAQRREIEKNDLLEVIQVIQNWQKDNKLNITPLAHSVSKANIKLDGVFNLTGQRYQTKRVFAHGKWPLVKLGDLCEIARGGSPRPIDAFLTQDPDGINWIKIGDANEGDKYITKTAEKIIPEGLKKTRLVKPGDFILSNSMSFGRPYIMKIGGAIHDGWLLLRLNDKTALSDDYLYLILGSNILKEEYSRLATGGVVNNLNSDLVRNVEIPLPPLEIQQQIVTELSQYQKVIDGARMVVENYRPYIKVEKNWPYKPLSEVCILNPKKIEINGLKPSTPVSFVPMSCVHENDPSFTPEGTKALSEVIKGYTYFKEKDVLLAKITPCFENGKAGIAGKLENKIGFGSTEFHVLRTTEAVLPEWIYHFVTTTDFRSSGILRMTGSAGQQRIPTSFVEEYQIPVPSIRVQQKAIEHTLRERIAVTQNEILIEHMQRRIEAKLAEIWGDPS